MRFNLKSFLLGLSLSFIVLVSAVGGAIADRIFVITPLDNLVERSGLAGVAAQRQILKEESAVIDVVKNISPSVVTVAIQTPERQILEFSPFGGLRQRTQEEQQQDIGSGFIVSSDGLVITNKHVVSQDAQYVVITQDGTQYQVSEINPDPANDLAILKIDADNLQPVELGQDDLQVGQFVIAIGTALGEFRHTVTTGVVSGLGRGIVAGSVYEGYVEELNDVIQTDAAINPGNSGGPLLNSSGQVIGVNVAVAAGAENIGFAIPVEILKKALDEFEKTGTFASKAFLGVTYQMINERNAIMNEVPQGAYITDVVPGSAADRAGVDPGDIITGFDGQRLADFEDGLAEVINQYEVGDRVEINIWRDGEFLNLTATLSASE